MLRHFDQALDLCFYRVFSAVQVQAVPDDVHAPGRNGYVHSGDFIPHEEVLAGGQEGASCAQGGMKTRVKHYFGRQKYTPGLAAAD